MVTPCLSVSVEIRFVLFRFRSPLLTSLVISFPPPTKMLQFGVPFMRLSLRDRNSHSTSADPDICVSREHRSLSRPSSVLGRRSPRWVVATEYVCTTPVRVTLRYRSCQFRHHGKTVSPQGGPSSHFPRHNGMPGCISNTPDLPPLCQGIVLRQIREGVAVIKTSSQCLDLRLSFFFKKHRLNMFKGLAKINQNWAKFLKPLNRLHKVAKLIEPRRLFRVGLNMPRRHSQPRHYFALWNADDSELREPFLLFR